MPRDMRKIRDRNTTDLQAEVDELRQQLFQLRWQAATGQLENPMKIRAVRRQIARHLTVLRQRELGAPAGEAG